MARQIEWNKALSGHYVFTSGPNEIDDIEGRFLELNDLLLLVTNCFFFPNPTLYLNTRTIHAFTSKQRPLFEIWADSS